MKILILLSFDFCQENQSIFMPNSEEPSHDDNLVLGECALAADKILIICHELDISNIMASIWRTFYIYKNSLDRFRLHNFRNTNLAKKGFPILGQQQLQPNGQPDTKTFTVVV